MGRWIWLLCLSAAAVRAVTFGGATIYEGPSAGECIPAAERAAIEQSLAMRAETGIAATLPQQYRFQPIAGNLWQDRYILNFFDVDPTPGILDWDCSQYTYDGHKAADIMIRGFGEQDAGVPLFAALDGVVAFAHDGENDRNTTLEGQPANYVILHHGGTHYSWYWHLRKGSVAVSVGQSVTAGTQIGQVGSSGHSETPHVHFESRFDGYAYETYSGACHPGPRHWANQTSIPRHTWISDLALHNSNNIPAAHFYPHNPPRKGTFVRTGAMQTVGAWYAIHNEPAIASWRARYLRPDGSVRYDSGTRRLNNRFNRMAARWFAFDFDLDTSGVWMLELSIEDQVLFRAPFLVVNAGAIPTNRAPFAPSAMTFDPPAPGTNDAVFCRLTIPAVQDADYDLVSYEYRWYVNGALVRHTTNAAFADAIPRGLVATGDWLRCVVRPYDSQQFGPATEANIGKTLPPPLQISRADNGVVVISWPTSAVIYTLQASSKLNSEWSSASGTAVRTGSRLYQTNDASGGARFYRLEGP